MEHWLGAAVGWTAYLFHHATVWLPLVLSTVATGISILAFRRGAPPVKPRAWATYSGRGPRGFTVSLNVDNHTDSTIRLSSVKSPGYKLGVNGRSLPADRKEWEPPASYEYDWVDEVPLSVELAPGKSFSANVVFSSAASNDSISASLVLSISTMRRTIKARTMVIPIIIPATN